MDDMSLVAARIERELAAIHRDLLSALTTIQQHLAISSIAQMYQANPSHQELQETLAIIADLHPGRNREGSHA